jgi:hypothetical protein
MTVALLVGSSASRTEGGPSDPQPRVDRKARTVSVPATVQAKRFDALKHHLVTWEKGRARRRSLFPTPVSDRAVLKALLSLGAKPGENLTVATWEERKDRDHPDPDKRAEGDRIEIFVTWKGLKQPLPVWKLFARLGPQAFDFRFAGNGRWIDHFKSGCVACTPSCPGAKVANRQCTIREHIRAPERFELKPNILPPDGTPVTVIFKVAGEPTRSEDP